MMVESFGARFMQDDRNHMLKVSMALTPARFVGTGTFQRLAWKRTRKISPEAVKPHAQENKRTRKQKDKIDWKY